MHWPGLGYAYVPEVQVVAEDNAYERRLEQAGAITLAGLMIVNLAGLAAIILAGPTAITPASLNHSRAHPSTVPPAPQKGALRRDLLCPSIVTSHM